MNSQETRFPPTSMLATSSVRIEAVAFDMDGLMLNTEDLYEHVGSLLMQRRGKQYREEVRNRMIGLPAPKAFGVLIECESLTETWQELQRETDEIFESLLDTELRTMPGLNELLDEVDRRQLPRCVATSSSRRFATRALEIVDMLKRVDFVITAEDVEHGKPHPDIYLAAAQRMGTTPRSMLVLEDSDTGTRAGVAAGASVISVPNRHTSFGKFEGAVCIAEGLHDKQIYEALQNGVT